MKPTTRVYIAFDTGWAGTSPTWTEVTSRVRHDPGIGIEYGRSEELASGQPNQMSLVLRNDDGRFTPGNTASPYYPNVVRSRRIKVESTTLSGTTSIRFAGYIDDWRPVWFAKVGGINDSAITATSRFSRLGHGANLRSLVEQEYLVNAPLAYYTMGEAAGATAAADSSGNGGPALQPAGVGALPTFGATGVSESSTAVQFDGGRSLIAPLAATFSGATTVAVDAFITLTSMTGVTSEAEILRIDDGNLFGGGYLRVYIDTARQLSADVFNTATQTGSTVTGSPITIGQTYHVGIVVNPSAGTFDFYRDGVVIGSGSGIGAISWTSTRLRVTNEDPLGVKFRGAVSHVSVWTGTAGAMSAHAAAAQSQFVGESSSTRITRYAGYIGLPLTELDLDAGQVPGLANIDITGKTALDAMREVEAAEAGVLFDARDGRLTFHNRAHRYSAASAFTLAYTARQIADGIEPVHDDQHLLNDVTVTSTSGQVVGRATNTTSVNAYGWYRDTPSVATVDADEPLERASWLVNRYGDPGQRVSAVPTFLNALPDTLTASVLAATIGTRFTVTGLPANAPASSMGLFVEGASETITNDEHRIVFHTSPAEIFDVWTIEDPVLGQYDAYPLAL